LLGVALKNSMAYSKVPVHSMKKVKRVTRAGNCLILRDGETGKKWFLKLRYEVASWFEFDCTIGGMLAT